jgi:hypothetical protein
METKCAYCKWRTVEIQEGHRKRQYCSDGCRQAAYRERKSCGKFSKRREVGYQAIAALGDHWSEFSWTTQYFLQTVCLPLGESFVEQVAKVIADERTQAMLKVVQLFHPPLQDEGQS